MASKRLSIIAKQIRPDSPAAVDRCTALGEKMRTLTSLTKFYYIIVGLLHSSIGAMIAMETYLKSGFGRLVSTARLQPAFWCLLD